MRRRAWMVVLLGCSLLSTLPFQPSAAGAAGEAVHSHALGGSSHTRGVHAALNQVSRRGFREPTGEEIRRLGLRPGTGPCEGLFEFPGATPGDPAGCTHGPDVYDLGYPGAPRVPEVGGAEIPATPPGIPCFRTGPFVHVFYVYKQANRLDAAAPGGRRPLIREAVALADSILAESAEHTGGVRHVRWRTRNCGLLITPAKMRLDLDPWTMSRMLVGSGKLKPGEKGLAFIESQGGCWGLGNIWPDDRRSSTNPNNRGKLFARVQLSCIDGGKEPIPAGEVALHEVFHTMGAVQRSAPNSTPTHHCDDDSDVMCYEPGTREVCPATSPELLDCQNNDYFHTDAPGGSYLARHWNTARNRFLAKGAPRRWDRLGRATINIADPPIGSSVAGLQRVEVQATPLKGTKIRFVRFYANGDELTEDTSPPFATSVETRYDGSEGFPNGTELRIGAVAVDSYYRPAVVEASFQVANPKVRLIQPAPWQVVGGNLVWSAAAEAHGGKSVESVVLLVNENEVEVDTEAPFGGTVDLSAHFADEWARVSARVTDSAGAVRDSPYREIWLRSPDIVLMNMSEQELRVGGPVTLLADVHLPWGVSEASVEFLANGEVVGTASAAPYRFSWTPPAPGQYEMLARVQVPGGPVVESGSGTVHVVDSAISVEVTSPTDGEVLTGETTLAANPSAESLENARVDFLVDGGWVVSAYAPPWEATLDTVQLVNGFHLVSTTLTVEDPDTFEQESLDSEGTVVSVSNPQASVNVLPPPSPASGTVTVGAHLVVPAGHEVSEVNFYANGEWVDFDDTAPYEVSWDSTNTPDGPVELRAEAWAFSDSAPSYVVTSDPGMVAVENLAIVVTSPSDGQVVSGYVTLSAAVTEDPDTIVEGVEFFVDDVRVAVDFTAPFSSSWDSTSIGNGSHTLRARVVTTDGRAPLSGSVIVTVAN